MARKRKPSKQPKLSKAQRRAKYINEKKQRERDSAENQLQPNPQAPEPAHIKEAAEKTPPQEGDATTHSHSQRKPIVRQPATVADWVIAAFTGVLTVFAIVQGCAMLKQINQTDKTLELMQNQQRAWLVTKNPGYIDIKEGADISVSTDLINLGGASAFVRHYEVDAYFGLPKQSLVIDEERISAHAIITPFWEEQLKPGEKMPMGLKLVSGAKPEDVAAFDKGNAWFYIVFTYIYDDPLRQNVTRHVAFARSRNVAGFVPWPIEGGGENDRN